MTALHLVVFQAEFGDALLLEHEGSLGTHRYLIDGGPIDNYATNVRAQLESVAKAGGKLDVVVLSHVDNDHVLGLLDLLAELDAQHDAGAPLLIDVGEVWHNSFALIPGDPASESKVKAAVQAAGATMMSLDSSIHGVGEGNKLRLLALKLGLPLNQPFPNGEVRVETAPVIDRDGLRLQVVGPSKANLDALRKAWLKWLEDHEAEVSSGLPLAAASADGSVPNLSSVCLLATAGGHSVLLTGDARGDHIVANLEALELMPPVGSLHVDLLKMPHHGSDRNVAPSFFDRITADRYVFSANGRDGNPDMATLIWLAESLKRQGRSARIFVTNRTDSTRKLVELYPPAAFGYQLTILSASRRFARLTVG